MNTFANQAVVVTGGGRGLGSTIAAAFAAQGAFVGIVDRAADNVASAVENIRSSGGRIEGVAADVGDFDQLGGALDAIQSRLGRRFTIVVNNAGISPKHDGAAHRVWEMAAAEWNEVVAINLGGAFNTIRHVTPTMRLAGGGSIINMSSTAGKTFTPIVGVHYAATKAALIGLTKHLAGELGSSGVTVNAIAPGRIATSMIQAVAQSVNDEAIRATPMGRLGTPQEVADLAVFLASDKARFITGQVCDVAGGFMLT